MKNTFAFYDDYTGWPSLVCPAFLNDRPSSALKNIQHIALNIDDESLRSYHPANNSVWTLLCAALKAKLTLHNLALNLDFRCNGLWIAVAYKETLVE